MRNWIRTSEEIRFHVRLRVVVSGTVGILWVYFRIYRRYFTIGSEWSYEGKFSISSQWLNIRYSYCSPDRLLLKRKKLHHFLVKKKGENINLFFFNYDFSLHTLCTVYVLKSYDSEVFSADLAAWSVLVCVCVCVCVWVCARARVCVGEREREIVAKREKTVSSVLHSVCFSISSKRLL